MPNTKGTIGFEHKGIGQVLAENRLQVPINQRSYMWEDEHILDLFQDFANALASSDDSEYFLGTIVLTQGESDTPEVADGQQRMATTTILLAGIRDYLFRNNNKTRADTLTSEYLVKRDLKTEELMPRLQLNVDDNEFFSKYVLALPGEKERTTAKPTKTSHERIQRAAELAAAHIENIVSPHKDENRVRTLIDWVEFVRSSASVILIRVPDQINAYTMFETLNDRGLRAAQSDILKNYLFGKAKERLKEVQPKWAAMVGALETVGEDDLTVTYIRHYWITQEGPTKERELSKRIKDSVASKQRSVELVTSLEDSAQHYVALLNPNHEKWNAYGQSTRRHIEVISNKLKVEQIRPLMFAVARHFAAEEAKKAFRMFVAWSVRFLIAGGRGGLLDRAYSLNAQQVGTGKIKTAKQLVTAMTDVVPTDAVFEASFMSATVSQTHLARYYLRALELQIKQDPEPELVPNDNEDQINLEHILPVNPSNKWGIDPEVALALYKRIGNMALLQAKVNVALGNESFADKKAMFKDSAFILTQQIAKQKTWGLAQINKRQKDLAELAVKTWPIKPK